MDHSNQNVTPLTIEEIEDAENCFLGTTCTSVEVEQLSDEFRSSVAFRIDAEELINDDHILDHEATEN